MSNELLSEVESESSTLPSKGAAGHTQGKCKPCSYVTSKIGCAQGKNCRFCHFRHQKRNRQRLPRADRFQLLTLVQAAYDAGFKDQQELSNAEEQMAEFLNTYPTLTKYTHAVLRSLRRGSVLLGIHASTAACCNIVLTPTSVRSLLASDMYELMTIKHTFVHIPDGATNASMRSQSSPAALR